VEPIRLTGLESVEVLGSTVPVASSLPSRLLGLALLRRERAGAGLLIPRCRSIHTFGMRFPIDVFFLDAEGRVIELRRSVPPRRVIRSPGAIAVLEVSSP
jgi:uncharacterized membrane protein (UPF0127 family)